VGLVEITDIDVSKKWTDRKDAIGSCLDWSLPTPDRLTSKFLAFPEDFGFLLSFNRYEVQYYMYMRYCLEHLKVMYNMHVSRLNISRH
jgi:hypothetical protein